jgi:type IV pilus assembly protein PilO
MTQFTADYSLQITSNNRYRRNKVILTVLILIGILGCGYFATLRPLVTRWLEQEKHYATLQLELQQKQQASQPWQTQQATGATLQQALSSLLQKMPEQNNTQDLLTSLAKAGTDNGLIVNLVKPLPPQAHDVYSVLPLQLTVTGTYPQIVAFINQITHFNNIMTFPQFTITHANPLLSTAMNNAPGKADNLLLSMTVMLYINNSNETTA